MTVHRGGGGGEFAEKYPRKAESFTFSGTAVTHGEGFYRNARAWV